MLPVFGVVRWFATRSRVHYRESRVASARLIVNFVETMTGMRAVQAFRREAANDARYGELSEDYRHNNMRTFNLNGDVKASLASSPGSHCPETAPLPHAFTLFTLAETTSGAVASKRIGPNAPASSVRPKSEARTLSKAVCWRAASGNDPAATTAPDAWS